MTLPAPIISRQFNDKFVGFFLKLLKSIHKSLFGISHFNFPQATAVGIRQVRKFYFIFFLGPLLITSIMVHTDSNGVTFANSSIIVFGIKKNHYTKI